MNRIFSTELCCNDSHSQGGLSGLRDRSDQIFTLQEMEMWRMTIQLKVSKQSKKWQNKRAGNQSLGVAVLTAAPNIQN